MSRLYFIDKFLKILIVSVQTLENWNKKSWR